MDREPYQQRGSSSERRSLMWLGVAAFLLVAASVGLIVYEDQATHPLHVQSNGPEIGN